jgi:hypothetical protein
MDTKIQIAKLRFESKINKSETGCYEWNGTLFKTGYGIFAYNGANKLAHRMAWFFDKGELPNGVLLHSCDNRKCVNMSHLKEGTQYENIHDMIDKGRRVISYSENNGIAKLTYQQAVEIRNRYKTEQVSQSVLAKEYSVNQSVISRVIGGKIYTTPPKEMITA